MILETLFNTRSIENPAIPMSSKNILEYFGGGQTSRSGELVNSRTALQVSPVWAAVSLLSGDISTLPLHVYNRVDTEAGRGKENATNHPLWSLLYRHTGYETANIWLQTLIAQALLFGDGYSRIHRTRTGRVTGLEFMHADSVKMIKKKMGDRTVRAYEWTAPKGSSGNETVVPLGEDDVFHLRGLTLSDWGGLSLIDYARNTIGRQIAAEAFGDDLYSEHGAISGFFTPEFEMSKEAQEHFVRYIKKRHQKSGGGKRFRYSLLDPGMKYQDAGVNAKDAAMVEALEFGVEDVARFFQVPSYKLGATKGDAYKTVEAKQTDYLRSSLMVWLKRVESEGNYKLRSTQEQRRDSPFIEFKFDAILRGDSEARMKSHTMAIQWGIKSRNEARAEENLNPYPGGDVMLIPLNHAPSDMDGEDGNDDTESSERSSPNDLDRKLAVRDVSETRLHYLAGVIVKIGHRTATRAAKSGETGDFVKLSQDVGAAAKSASESIAEYLQRELVPVANLLAAETGGDRGKIRDQMAATLIRESQSQLFDACEWPLDELPGRVAESEVPIRAAATEVIDKILTGGESDAGN